MREARAETSTLPTTHYFFLGTPDQADSVFAERDPGAIVISDPKKHFYRAFGLGRGTLAQLFGLSVWKRGLEAACKGHSIGRPGGQSVRTMPGAFLIDHRGTIIAEHHAEHAGDHVDIESVCAIAQSARRS